MPLDERIVELMGRALEELDELALYVTRTQQVWRLVQELAGDPTWSGVWLRRVSQADGLIPVTEGGDPRFDLQWLSGRATEYAGRYLAESAFQQALAVLESFVADLLVDWLTAHPGKLVGERQVRLGRVLAAGVDAVVGEEVDQLVLSAMTGGPRQWFEFLTQHTGLPAPPADQLDRLAEAKATRDLLIHNRGIVTQTYLKKAGARHRAAVGDLIEVPEPYRRDIHALLRQLVTDLSDAALTKLGPNPPLPPAGG